MLRLLNLDCQSPSRYFSAVSVVQRAVQVRNVVVGHQRGGRKQRASEDQMCCMSKTTLSKCRRGRSFASPVYKLRSCAMLSRVCTASAERCPRCSFQDRLSHAILREHDVRTTLHCKQSASQN